MYICWKCMSCPVWRSKRTDNVRIRSSVSKGMLFDKACTKRTWFLCWLAANTKRIVWTCERDSSRGHRPTFISILTSASAIFNEPYGVGTPVNRLVETIHMETTSDAFERTCASCGAKTHQKLPLKYAIYILYWALRCDVCPYSCVVCTHASRPKTTIHMSSDYMRFK